MAEKFTVNNEFDEPANCNVVDDKEYSGDKINTIGDEEDLSGGEENVGNHVVDGGVFAIFGSFIFGKGPFFGAGAVENVG